ncbi:F-box protein CPR1-like isoform X1 [Apium graveolens]|uniref:F-box protein CPR1-like isoform X1 n=1 Tax=Apium graveolens TaxID=4045 RepID=UPI003D79D565
MSKSTSTLPSSTTSDLAQILGDGYLTGTSHLPQELLLEVLLRVPVKPLLRFRCVSKPWCSLIDNTCFGLKHLEKSIECNPDSGIIVREISKSGKGKQYLVDVDSEDEFTAAEIGDSLKTDLSGTSYVGTCNGLVCLWKRNDQTEDDIFLWNPATRKIRKLPRANNIPIPFMLIGSCVVGFGYDHVNDDYKVMRTYDSQIYNILVSVYSLKSNTWTRADTISNEIRIWGDFGVFANGSLYWLTDDNNIFAFDLGVHRHRELSYPAGMDRTGKIAIGLFALKRCLCLINNYPRSRTDFWLMNSNAEENFWTKILSVEQSSIPGFYKQLYPVASSKTGNNILLFVDGDKLMWYDHGKKKVKNVTLNGFPQPADFLVYTESLVQLGSKLCDDFKLDGNQNKMSDFLSKGFKLML